MTGGRQGEQPHGEGDALHVLLIAVSLVAVTSLIWFWVARAPVHSEGATITVRPLEALDTRR